MYVQGRRRSELDLVKLLVVVSMDLLLGMLLCLVLLDLVQTFGFGELVNNTTGNTSNELLAVGVVNRLAVLLAVFVVRLGSFVGSGAGDELMRELAFMLA